MKRQRRTFTPEFKREAAKLVPDQQKIQELEAHINRLEREKAILKKLPLS